MLFRSEWDNLFTLLTGLNHRFSTTASDLTELTLADYIGAGNPAVVIIVEQTIGAPEITIDPKLGAGFYSSTQFTVINDYAGTDDLATMENDQYPKMADNKANYFLLSWTLTQGTADAIAARVGFGGILALAAQANNALLASLLGQQYDVFPNIILTDNIRDARSAAAAMCLHYRQWVQPAAQFIPGGSYQLSCSNIKVSLSAVAASAQGPKMTAIGYDASQAPNIGDISNNNGVLTIQPATSKPATLNNGFGPYIPAGSYQNSCDLSSIQITLSANCTPTQGQPVPSSLVYRGTDAACFTDIANINGQLTPVKSS